jgi:hypothetical protein
MSDDHNRRLLQEMKVLTEDLLSFTTCDQQQSVSGKMMRSNLEHISDILNVVLDGVTSNDRVYRWNARLYKHIAIVKDITVDLVLLKIVEQLMCDHMHLTQVFRDFKMSDLYREFIVVIRAVMIQNKHLSTLFDDSKFNPVNEVLRHLNVLMRLDVNLNRDNFEKMLRVFMNYAKCNCLTMNGTDNEYKYLTIHGTDHTCYNPMCVNLPFPLKLWWEKVSSVPYSEI